MTFFIFGWNYTFKVFINTPIDKLLFFPPKSRNGLLDEEIKYWTEH